VYRTLAVQTRAFVVNRSARTRVKEETNFRISSSVY
jgi:hypothetical protein